MVTLKSSMDWLGEHLFADVLQTSDLGNFNMNKVTMLGLSSLVLTFKMFFAIFLTSYSFEKLNYFINDKNENSLFIFQLIAPQCWVESPSNYHS